jgi:hypothetical protein
VRYLGFTSSAHAHRSLLCLRPASAPVLLTHGAVVLISVVAVRLHHRWCRSHLHPRSVFAMVVRQLSGPPAPQRADGSASRAMRAAHTVLSVCPLGVTIAGAVSSPMLSWLQHLCVLLLRSHRVLRTLRGRSIWYYLSIFFFSPYPRTVYCDSVIPSVCVGVMVHTALQSCARPQSSSSLPSAYLYALFFSFPSPFPFPPHLSSMTLILSFVKLVFSPG